MKILLILWLNEKINQFIPRRVGSIVYSFIHALIQQMSTICQLSVKFQVLCGKGNTVSAFMGVSFVITSC